MVLILARWYLSVFSMIGLAMIGTSVGWFLVIKSVIFLKSLDSLIVATLVVNTSLLPLNSCTMVSVTVFWV